MTKKYKLILIPLIVIVTLLVYCWIIILTTDILATWRHYVGLISFAGLLFLFFKSINRAIILTGVYLLLATANVLAMTSEINTSWMSIGPLSTPPIQVLSLLVLVLYFILNMNSLFDIYLDYKEGKEI